MASSRQADDQQQDVIEMRKALGRQIAAHAHSEGENPTAVDALVLFRHAAPSACH